MASVSTAGDSFTPDSLGEGAKTPVLPRIGQLIWLPIPQYDDRGRFIRNENRQVSVLALEDMANVGFSLHSVARTARVLRGRWRVTFWDARRWKKAAAFLDAAGECALQIGHFDLRNRSLAKLVGRQYSQSGEDQIELSETCRELMKSTLDDDDRYTFRVFAVPAWTDSDVIALA